MKKKKLKQYLAAGLSAIMVAELIPINGLSFPMVSYAETKTVAESPSDALMVYDSDFGKLITNVQLLHSDSLEAVTEDDPIVLGEEAVFRFTYKLTDEMQDLVGNGEDLEFQFQLPKDVLHLTESYDDLVGEEFCSDYLDTIGYRGEYREEGELGIWLYSEEKEIFDAEYLIDVPITIDSRIALDTEDLLIELGSGEYIKYKLIIISSGFNVNQLSLEEYKYEIPNSNIILTYTVDNDEATIVSCNEDAKGDVFIPNDINGYETISIGDHAFENCVDLLSIEIPESVKSIGNYSFYKCNKLSSVILTEGITSIGGSAFSQCGSLVSIKIPNSITDIKSNTFEGCSNLTSIDLSNELTGISSYAFYGCSSLVSISFPETLTDINEKAFFGCSSLLSVEIPYGVTSLKSDTFYGCSSLKSVKLPDSITTINGNVFRGCESLTSIKIPNQVAYIGSRVFENCINLNNVYIPISVKEIYSTSFADCISLTDVYYEGNETEWEQIQKGSYNDDLLNATIHFNASEETSDNSIYYLANYEINDNRLHLSYPIGSLNYIGDLGFEITEETDTSFMDQIDSWIGKYVCVTVKENEEVDGEAVPDTLLSVEIVETKLGKVTSVEVDAVKIDGNVFPHFRNVYKDTTVIYWMKDGAIVDFELLHKGKGRLESASVDDRTITISKEIGSGKNTYMLSPLMGDEIFSKLNDLKLEEITFLYGYGNQIYFISEVPNNMYFVPTEKLQNRSFCRNTWIVGMKHMNNL